MKPNPCDGVKTGSSGTREAILEDSDGYQRLFATLDKMETERRIRSPVADAIRLIALTGCRRGRGRRLALATCRFEARPYRVATAVAQDGAKDRKAAGDTIAGGSAKIIARQPEGNPDDLVFAPARGDGAIALSKAWRKVRKEADLPPARITWVASLDCFASRYERCASSRNHDCHGA